MTHLKKLLEAKQGWCIRKFEHSITGGKSAIIVKIFILEPFFWESFLEPFFVNGTNLHDNLVVGQKRVLAPKKNTVPTNFLVI